MAKILLISNGHGEDLSASLIGEKLKKNGHIVDAFPLVGIGKAYNNLGIGIYGNVKEFTTGGLGYTSLYGRFTEIIQGQIFYLLGRLLLLWRVAYKYDVIFVVGDVVPIICAWTTGLPVITYLVAYSSHYEGRLKMPWPCSYLLSSKKFLAIYTRDQFTADDLSRYFSNVSFLGNPFMEPLLKNRVVVSNEFMRVGLLPGSRRPELDSNLSLILRVVEYLPFSNYQKQNIRLDMALVSSMEISILEKIVTKSGWLFSIDNSSNILIRKETKIIRIYYHSFEEIIQNSDVILSMSGTAAEQAIGLAKPVVQLEGFGPQFTASFAEAQRRLLGPTVFCANGKTGEDENIYQTSLLLMKLLEKSKYDNSFKRKCKEEALKRLGPPGGVTRIADASTCLINNI